MQKQMGALALLLLGLVACRQAEPPPMVQAQAYVPVYRQATNITDIQWTTARPLQNAGKQYVYGHLLLQNEQQEGIHIYDVSVANAPRSLGFLKIPLCTEMAVHAGKLYANNYADLLVFDLQASGGPVLLKRMANVFPPANQDYPPFFNTPFVCPDPAKGVVVDWVLQNNVEANCRR